MTDDIPEEDRFLEGDTASYKRPCAHDYVDFYCGWGSAKDDHQSRLVWLFCKKCLNTRQLRLNMHNVEHEDEE
jgi:hypothetical protein